MVVDVSAESAPLHGAHVTRRRPVSYGLGLVLALDEGISTDQNVSRASRGAGYGQLAAIITRAIGSRVESLNAGHVG